MPPPGRRASALITYNATYRPGAISAGARGVTVPRYLYLRLGVLQDVRHLPGRCCAGFAGITPFLGMKLYHLRTHRNFTHPPAGQKACGAAFDLRLRVA